MKYAVSQPKSTVKSKAVAPPRTQKSQEINLTTKKKTEKTLSPIVTKKTANKSSGDAQMTATKKLAAAKKTAPILAKKSVKKVQKVSVKLTKPVVKSIVKTSPKKLAVKSVTDKSKISINNKPAKTLQTVVSKNDSKITTKTKIQKSAKVKINDRKTVSPSKPKVAIAKINLKKTAKSKLESKLVKTIQPSKSRTAKNAVPAKIGLTNSAKNKIVPKKLLISAAKSKLKPKINSKLIVVKKIAAPKVSNQPAKTSPKKTQKPKSVASKKSVEKSKHNQTFTLPIMIDGVTRKIKSVAAIRSSERQVEKDVKTETLEVVAPVVKIEARSAKPKKAKPIGSAIFRGVKERYDFKVFELSDIFEPIPAVYIISKRKTDWRKKGHHALICIGETTSVADELKRHRKGKCVKKHQANAVSILPEPDEKARLKIENDLKAAHSIVCNLN